MNRLFSYFKDYFSETTKPTAKNLFLILLAILTLDTFRSMRFAHRHVISKMTNTSLNAFYYTLQTDSLKHLLWNDVTTKKALSIVPEQLDSQPQIKDSKDAVELKEVKNTIEFKNAQITSGGVNVSEVSNSLESKLHKNLYFMGEILDADGICGGYNLQWAFTSAMIASEDVLNAKKDVKNVSTWKNVYIVNQIIT